MIRRATAFALFSFFIMDASAAMADWVPCAREGGLCRVPYPTTVRYGARGRFAEGQVDRAVRCSNDNFGDPINGVVKSCFYYERGGGRGGWDRRDHWDRRDSWDEPPPRRRHRDW